MPITQRQARQEISKLIEKYQAMPKPDRQTITEAGVDLAKFLAAGGQYHA